MASEASKSLIAVPSIERSSIHCCRIVHIASLSPSVINCFLSSSPSVTPRVLLYVLPRPLKGFSSILCQSTDLVCFSWCDLLNDRSRSPIPKVATRPRYRRHIVVPNARLDLFALSDLDFGHRLSRFRIQGFIVFCGYSFAEGDPLPRISWSRSAP